MMEIMVFWKLMNILGFGSKIGSMLLLISECIVRSIGFILNDLFLDSI